MAPSGRCSGAASQEQAKRAQRLYDAEEMTVEEIARLFGCKRSTIYNYVG
jgi:DNA invertase Pin-like site-specific DNA recombinase